MAFITKMCVSPAEPLSDWTAESAFEWDVLFAVLFTVCCFNWTATRADKFFGVEFFSCFWVTHGLSATFSSSEVRLMALEAFEICVDSHWVLLLIPKVRWRCVIEYFVLICAFISQSFRSFVFDLIKELLILLYYFSKWRFLRQLQPFVAKRALTKPEDDSCCFPFQLQTFFQALEVENMATLTSHTRRLAQGLDVA